MPLPEYIGSYRERRWATYRLPADAADAPLTASAEPALFICDSDSIRAAELKEDPLRFYVDCELLAAELDLDAGCQVTKLTAPWREHPAGRLVIVSYEAIRAGQLVYAIEI